MLHVTLVITRSSSLDPQHNLKRLETENQELRAQLEVAYGQRPYCGESHDT